jgi:aryl-alcohol dehydrogenase-like predicted oxidoreductase
MKYKNYVGDLLVSELGFGGWPLGNTSRGKKMTDEAGVKLVQNAIDLGINFFDTAPNYASSQSEIIIGEATKDIRDKVVINTKFGHHMDDVQDFSSNKIRPSLMSSLQRLQTTYVDSLILHNPPREILLGQTDHFRILETLKSEGLVLGYGVSIDTKEELELTLKHLNVEVIELLFNVFFQDTKVYFDEIKKRGIRLIIKVPLDSGWLTGKYNKTMQFDGIKSRWSDEVKLRRHNFVEKIKSNIENSNLVDLALGFIWSFDAVTTIIPGIRTNKQLLELISATNYKISDIDKVFLEYIYDQLIKDDPLPW